MGGSWEDMEEEGWMSEKRPDGEPDERGLAAQGSQTPFTRRRAWTLNAGRWTLDGRVQRTMVRSTYMYLCHWTDCPGRAVRSPSWVTKGHVRFHFHVNPPAKHGTQAVEVPLNTVGRPVPSHGSRMASADYRLATVLSADRTLSQTAEMSSVLSSSTIAAWIFVPLPSGLMRHPTARAPATGNLLSHAFADEQLAPRPVQWPDPSD
ncbi:hypothetical protein G7046_g7710 [Stylonectria norvegica]|nr:hypothetical protein G7046_g7710 [Stylonectria norvegica]